ncbi:hypothetical protein FS749_007651 [Ceratobasidium sp. UAMH 11750]|nr:hypothetical protein FS749_007651 [Ceratobasidium sp. UAMH 11750]
MTSHRPLAISELANRVRPTGYDPAKSQGDLENAFIHFGKAATLMLEELPTHPKYNELRPDQKEAVVLVRTNLKSAKNNIDRVRLCGRHGQLILDSMTEIKPILFDRFSDWHARHPDADLSATTPPYQPSRRPKPLPELPDARRGDYAESTGNRKQQTSRTDPASPGSVLISNPYDQITKVIAHGQQGVGRQMQEGIGPSEGESRLNIKSEIIIIYG